MSPDEPGKPASPTNRPDSVGRINDLVRRGGVETALRLGRFLLARYFGGDPERFEAEHRRAPAYRRLVRHPALQVCEVTLTLAVRVTAQVDALPPGIGQALTVTGHRALLAVQDSVRRHELATTAATEGWSPRRLRNAAGRMARQELPKPGAGRPRLAPWMKRLNLVHRTVSALVAEPLEAPGPSDGDAERARRTLRLLEEDLVRLQELRVRLGALVEQLN